MMLILRLVYSASKWFRRYNEAYKDCITLHFGFAVVAHWKCTTVTYMNIKITVLCLFQYQQGNQAGNQQDQAQAWAQYYQVHLFYTTQHTTILFVFYSNTFYQFLKFVRHLCFLMVFVKYTKVIYIRFLRVVYALSLLITCIYCFIRFLRIKELILRYHV